jgi:hypothetical protein
VLLRPLLVFVHREEVTGAMGEITRCGHLGAQHEAGGLFLQTADALCLGSDGGLEPLAHGFDRARLLGAGPAPAIHGPCLHGDIHQMRGGGHGVARRRRGFRIGAAAIRLRLSSTGSGLDRVLPHIPHPLGWRST